eukprot:1888172-Lingulodinium_polyedra.AAC.1
MVPIDGVATELSCITASPPGCHCDRVCPVRSWPCIDPVKAGFMTCERGRVSLVSRLLPGNT